MNIIKSLLLTLLAGAISANMYAQPNGYAAQQNVSTEGQCLACSADNPNNSIDGDLNTFAQLNVDFALPGASITQKLTFPFVGNVGQEIVLVLGFSDTLSVSEVSNIKLSTWIGTQQNNDERQINAGGLSGIGSNKFAFAFNAQFNFDAVNVQLEAPNSAALSNLRIYAAYVSEALDPINLPCYLPNASSEGVIGTCTACDVINLGDAYDGDVDTYSELSVGLSGPTDGVFQSFEWIDEACGIDSVKLTLSAGAGLDLGALPIDPTNPGGDDGAIRVAALDIGGNVIPGSEKSVETTGLNPLGSEFTYEYIYVPPASLSGFYGIRVLYGGLSFSSSIQLHEICLMRFQPPAPIGSSIITPCYNTVETLTVTPAPNTVSYWYKTNNPSDMENDAIYIGQTFDPTANNPSFLFTNDTVFYFFSRNVDKDCFSLEYDSILVDVHEQLPNPLMMDLETCFNSELDIFPQPFGPIFNMYEDENGTTPIQLAGSVFRVGPILSDTTFWVQTTNEDGCISDNIVPINVNLKEELFFPNAPDEITACIGEMLNVDLIDTVVGVTYNWYAGPDTGAVLLYTGTSYEFLLTGNTDLYIDAVAVAGGCEQSAFRHHVDITAVPKPTLTPGDQFVLVCENDSIVITGSSSAGDVVWYDALTGGNELFTGDAFTIYDNGGIQEVYAEATNDRCLADARELYTIMSTTLIIDEINKMNTSLCFGASDSIMLPIMNNISFTIWDDSLAGNQIGDAAGIWLSDFQQDTTFYVEINEAICTEPENNRVKVTVSVTTPPTFDVVSDEVFGCLNDFVNLMAANPNSAFTYTWKDDAGVELFVGDTFNVEIIEDTTEYFVQVAEGLCIGNTLKVTAYKAEEQVNPIFNDGNSYYICAGDNINVMASSRIDGAEFYWYTDSVNGSLVAQGVNLVLPQNTFFADTIFWVEARYENICGDGISDRVEAYIHVVDVLPGPIVTCGESGTDYVTFVWDNNNDAVEYEIFIEGESNSVVLAGTVNSYKYEGVAPDTEVKIDVYRKGVLDCQKSNVGFTSCFSQRCTFDVNKPEIIKGDFNICNGDAVTFQLKPSSVPSGNYAVALENITDGLTDNLVNVSSFVITENNTTARSYKTATTEQLNYVYRATFEMLDEPGCGPSEPINLTLNVNPVPVVNFVAVARIPSVVGQFINEFTFNIFTEDVDSIEFNFGDGSPIERERFNNLIGPVEHIYQEEGTYIVTLTVHTDLGCSATGTLDKPITVSTVPEFFIPNTFTPNGDNNNDNFRVFGENIELKTLKVYNQYGNELYRGADLKNGWDGTFEGEPQPSGVYAYVVVIEDFLGNKYNREGTVTLIRK